MFKVQFLFNGLSYKDNWKTRVGDQVPKDVNEVLEKLTAVYTSNSGPNSKPRSSGNYKRYVGGDRGGGYGNQGLFSTVCTYLVTCLSNRFTTTKVSVHSNHM